VATPLRQPEDGQYRPKHVAVHYIAIKYTSCDTVVFDCIPFSKFHTHNGDDIIPRRVTSSLDKVLYKFMTMSR